MKRFAWMGVSWVPKAVLQRSEFGAPPCGKQVHVGRAPKVKQMFLWPPGLTTIVWESLAIIFPGKWTACSEISSLEVSRNTTPTLTTGTESVYPTPYWSRRSRLSCLKTPELWFPKGGRTLGHCSHLQQIWKLCSCSSLIPWSMSLSWRTSYSMG